VRSRIVCLELPELGLVKQRRNERNISCIQGYHGTGGPPGNDRHSVVKDHETVIDTGNTPGPVIIDKYRRGCRLVGGGDPGTETPGTRQYKSEDKNRNDRQ